jgi:hypothetical protein
MMTVTDKNGRVVQQGETVTDFRGDQWTFQYATRAALPGKSGKVVVQANGATREFYDRIFGLSVTGEPSETPVDSTHRTHGLDGA